MWKYITLKQLKSGNTKRSKCQMWNFAGEAENGMDLASYNVWFPTWCDCFHLFLSDLALATGIGRCEWAYRTCLWTKVLFFFFFKKHLEYLGFPFFNYTKESSVYRPCKYVLHHACCKAGCTLHMCIETVTSHDNVWNTVTAENPTTLPLHPHSMLL